MRDYLPQQVLALAEPVEVFNPVSEIVNVAHSPSCKTGPAAGVAVNANVPASLSTTTEIL